MRFQSIEFDGVYRYATRDMVELALSAAREQLAEEPVATGIDWMHAFSQQGTSLRIRATLPVDGDRFVAAEVMGLLASHAVEGVVEAKRGGRALDIFPACCVL